MHSVSVVGAQSQNTRSGRQAARTPASREKVRPLTASDMDSNGAVSIGTLMSAASELAFREIGRGATIRDCKTLFLKPRPTDALRLTAQLLHQSEGEAVWQSRIAASDGQVLALIVQAFDISPADPSPPAPARGKTGSQPQSPVRQRRLDALVAAATRVIAEKGFANATTREIASAAGIHVPTLYQYVASKEDLLELVYIREMDLAIDALAAGVQPDLPARDRLIRLISNHIDVCQARRQEIGLLNREFKHLGFASRRQVVQQYRKLLAPFEAVLDAGIASGEFRNIDTFIVANFMDVSGDIWSLRQFFFDAVGFEHFKASVTDFLLAALETDTKRPR